MPWIYANQNAGQPLHRAAVIPSKYQPINTSEVLTRTLLQRSSKSHLQFRKITLRGGWIAESLNDCEWDELNKMYSASFQRQCYVKP